MNKQDLKIVFLGTPDFAVESLDALCKEGYNIVGVVTMPDKPAGRGHKLLHSPVKQYAEAHGLRLMQPVNLKDLAFQAELRSLEADLFIVIAFRMLPEAVWSMPRLGTFNLHASLLPRYRGAAPINWAVINGDTKTGVTTFFLKHEIDTGDIIDRVEVDILPEENVGDVHDKLMHLGAQLTLRTVSSILDGTLITTPQEQLVEAGTAATPAPKIFKDTCHLDWKLPARELHNLVRGLSPYPAAWTTITLAGDKEPRQLKIFITSPVEANDSTPGRLTTDGDRMFIDCADGRLEIKSLQIAGKRRMDTPDFLRGVNLNDAIIS